MQLWRQIEVSAQRQAGGLLAAVLTLQAILLGWTAFRNSPVVDEYAHFCAGLSHWRFHSFDLYRVNPPLVRTVATIPILATDCREDWHRYQSAALVREEFDVGRAFVSANGSDIFDYISIARLACIPFSLLGTVVCYRWARDLAGRMAGLFAAACWVVCPNMLAHGSLMTPDAAASATGVLAAYLFWRWLRTETWRAALMAGLALGLAALTKSTWLALFVLWPVLFVVTRILSGKATGFRLHHVGQLAVTLGLAIYVVNAGYLFEDSLRPIGTFEFTSSALSGNPADADGRVQPGNRFTGSALHWVPVPIPGNYLRGIDLQKSDFEQGQQSYLRGQWRDHGWWYYYLYALAVKTPVGMLLIAGLSMGILMRFRLTQAHATSLVLVVPPLAVLFLVSSQTGFNKHLRYVLPVLPFAFVAMGTAVGSLRTRSARRLRPLFCVLWLWAACSSLSVIPHSLVYFNQLAGGPANGHQHLLGSNLDWGQSLMALRNWNISRTDDDRLYVAYEGLIDPVDVGIDCQPVNISASEPAPGWYAISVNRLYNTAGITRLFADRSPEQILDHTMLIYRLRSED
jgi:4-amino-4-deoxy-L-arabinose transferase-like glycosyltransferase